MKVQSFEYFPQEDVMCIKLNSLKTSMIGENELQESVILYKEKGKVIQIEIQNFSEFKDPGIILSKNKVLDLEKLFNVIVKWRDTV